MSTPTYNEIRRLTNDLRTETKVKARRDLGMVLLNKLKNETILRKLLVEATPESTNWPEEDSVAAKRCRALSGMWSQIVMGAINIAESIVAAKKVKLTDHDVQLPYRLLLACDKSNEILGDPSVSIPLLAKKAVRSLLKYCLAFLNDEEAVTVGRLELLEMLSYLCSKAEYVGVFKYHNDFACILDEVLDYLTAEVEEENLAFFNEAAKALDNLFTTTKRLGIEMHIFFDDTFRVVSLLFKSYLDDPKKPLRPQAKALPHLYNTITSMIYFHPDYSIGPVKRFGRSILRHARKCYSKAVTPLKESLHSFLLAHLFLSQYAGAVQGRVAGHMGNLGKASLTPELLDQLLDVVMKDLPCFFEDKMTSPTAGKRRSVCWTPLEYRQRQHLELAVRLLASAQQEFLCKEQWDTVESTTVALLSSLQTRTKDGEWSDQEIIGPKDCPTSTFTNSPWMRHVLSHLASEVGWRTFATKQYSSEHSLSESPVGIESAVADLEKKFPFLERIMGPARSISGASSSMPTLSYLRIIGASAELFPAGQCWTSNIFDGWESLEPRDLVYDDLVICQRCTVDDFALLVFLLAALLEEQGGPTGGRQNQLCIVATLSRLAESTALFYRRSPSVQTESLSSLANSWRMVWLALFRSDLGYIESTKDTTSLSLGEVVVVLIRDIVKNKCTDPALWMPNGISDKKSSFLHHNQNQVWSLPVFRNASLITSAAPFDLICWMSQNTGLSDSENDQIDTLPIRIWMNDELNFSSSPAGGLPGRRQRLICLSLSVLERYLRGKESMSRKIVQSTTLALITLSQGKIPSEGLVDAVHWHGSRGASSSDDGDPFRHTTVARLSPAFDENQGWREACIQILWGQHQLIDRHQSGHPSAGFDITAGTMKLYRSFAAGTRSLDFVSEVEMSYLCLFVKKSIEDKILPVVSPQNDGFYDMNDEGNHDMASTLPEAHQSLALKAWLSFQLLTSLLDDTKALHNMSDHVHNCFRLLDQLVDPASFRDTVCDLAQISQALLEALSECLCEISLPGLQSLSASCRSMLRGYMGRLSDGSSHAEMAKGACKQRRSGAGVGDDFMEEEFQEQPIRNHLAPQPPTRLSMDSSSSDESQGRNRRKRKRSLSVVTSGHAKSARVDGQIQTIPDFDCAVEVGRLLLLLEPSQSNCELVCLALLGASADLDPFGLDGDIDLRAAPLCVEFLASRNVVLHGHGKRVILGVEGSTADPDETSVIQLLHKVVDMIRVNAGSVPLLDASGFIECATIPIAEIERFGKPTQKELQILMELFLFNDNIDNRPRLRALRMLAASLIFKNAGHEFHGVFDQHFPGIVKGALADSDRSVRRLALVGVNSALTFLDERKALHSLRKLIAPLTQQQDLGGRQKEFEHWYQQLGKSHILEDCFGETQVLDLFEIMEADSIYCRAVIAASVASNEEFLDSIFELSTIPVNRPELEFLCFGALEKIARLRNYGSTEAMLFSEHVALMHRFVKSGYETLPLLVTAPTIVRRMALSTGARGWHGQNADVELLRVDAFESYLEKNLHMMVALSFFQLMLSLPASESASDYDDEKALAFFVSNSKLQVLVSMYTSDDGVARDKNQAMRCLLQKCVADIRSFAYPMLQSGDTSHNVVADKALAFLTSLIPVEFIDSRTKKKADTILRGIVRLAALSSSLPTMFPPFQSAYAEGIIALIEDACSATRVTGDKFKYLGTNAIAGLIRSLTQLEKALVPFHKRALWRSVSLQAELIKGQAGNVNEKRTNVAFCVHVLTEVLLKEKFAILRPDVLALLKELLEEVMGSGDSPDFHAEIKPILKRLVGASFHVHEICQQKILECFRDEGVKTRRQLTRSCGLVPLLEGTNGLSGVWGWDASRLNSQSRLESIDRSASLVGEDIKRTIIGTYGILEWAFGHSERLSLDSLAFVPIAPPYDITDSEIQLLSSANSSFAVQLLALRQLEKPGNKWAHSMPSLPALGSELKAKLLNRQAWMACSARSEKAVCFGAIKKALNLDQRLIFALLVQIERELTDAQFDNEDDSNPCLEGLIGCLSFICCSPCPVELQIAAGRCLGKIEIKDALQYFNPRAINAPTVWPTKKSNEEEFLSSAQARCLEALARCLMAANPNISEIASDTLDALLNTNSGRHALSLVEKGPIRSQLDLFSPSFTRKETRRARSATLSENSLKELSSKARAQEQNLNSCQWCWTDALWLSFENDCVSFEDWVCSLTAALIVCCVSLPVDGKMRHRDGYGEFFWLCQRICASEHIIASTMFPYLVLYLLEATVEDSESDYNFLFTEAFDTILRRGDSCAASESGRKVLLLIIDTIDLLREISQAKFLSRQHPREASEIKGRRTSPDSRDAGSNYNRGIPECPSWEGVQFGVMLKLDGSAVAAACILVRRYASALFFLDMHLNAKFGKGGNIFDEFTRSSLQGTDFRGPSRNISGLLQDSSGVAEDEDVKKSILNAMSMVADCYRSMNEDDALEAIETQCAAIEFSNFGWDVGQSKEGLGDPISLLRSLNADAITRERSEAVDVAESMESLEFHGLLRSYINGIISDSSALQSMKDGDLEYLKEKWFEKGLRKRNWDGLKAEAANNVASSGQSRDYTSFRLLAPALKTGSSHNQGFFQSIASALDSFKTDDVISCRNHLDSGRMSLISEVARAIGLESPAARMVEVIDKLRRMEFLERAMTPNNDVSDKFLGALRPRADYGSFLGLMADCLHESSVRIESLADDVIVSTMWISELGLNSAYAKSCADRGAHRKELFECLVSQLCVSAVRARVLGRPHIAAESIQKLHRLLASRGQFHGIDEDSRDQIILLRLEESKILESQGEFKGAIRKSQQIVDDLVQREKVSGALTLQMEYALADAQISCGSWLTKYKIRQASSVLEDYLKPGTSRSKRLYESERTPENAERTARASLAMGQIVSSLHLALVARVKSPEWKRSSSTAHYISELERCEPMLQEADARKKKAKKNSKQFVEACTKWEELFIYCEHLRKDLRRTTDERQNVIDSMHEYLMLAVESYTTALAVASTGTHEDLLQHVSELMSLWFANCKAADECEIDINRSMQEAFLQIPSFRFVPLTNQLFSRIESSEDSRTDGFQAVLQGLVFKMCADHPYHCLLALLALANGMKVGRGIGGRSASAYIQNVGNSKVAPANAIMARLERDADPYVGGLLQSYGMLSDAYIHLAEAETDSFHKKITKDIPFSKVFPASLKTLDRCMGRGGSSVEFPPAIFTSPPKLQPGADYGGGLDDPVGSERIKGFRPVFGITETGLHRPKIVVCLGTKGGEYRQLVKGEDEIRQDAIMSQVFRFVNSLMSRRRATSDRNTGSKPFRHRLQMATYTVVPLSPASGVLEWVEDTSAFGDLVCGRGSKRKDFGLHSRYYPKEWSHYLCRTHINEAPPKVKREAYDVVCRHFSPCFRFFFVEYFGHDMMEWHSAKMRYTRSAAVSSMIGHILGIGDRHISNILVHTKTGELVHIDFGIVFEQGKVSRRVTGN